MIFSRFAGSDQHNLQDLLHRTKVRLSSSGTRSSIQESTRETETDVDEDRETSRRAIALGCARCLRSAPSFDLNLMPFAFLACPFEALAQ